MNHNHFQLPPIIGSCVRGATVQVNKYAPILKSGYLQAVALSLRVLCFTIVGKDGISIKYLSVKK